MNTKAMTSTERDIIATKEFRRDIDAIIQRLKDASGFKKGGYVSPVDTWRPSEERFTAIQKLQEAVMWLGMDLKVINDENPGAIESPYPNSKDPSNTKIDPTADGLML